MNSLSPPIFPDNTEVNGKMKMKCLNVNGDNVTEIITGPKITYRNGERSFLKSISIDGYRVTVSYIDELFQGATVDCNLRRNKLNVIYITLYPNGDTNISGESYNSVRKSWKNISFDITPDIQEGYIMRQNDHNSVAFDFILPSPSEHTLYSSFISDVKYISKNVEVNKLIDGEGKNDIDLRIMAVNNEPCLIISNTPQTDTDPSSITFVLYNSTTPTPVFYKATALGASGNLERGYPTANTNTEGSSTKEPLGFNESRLNYRLDEIENKLRKFGIE